MTHHLVQLASEWSGTLPPFCIAELKHDGFRGYFGRDYDGKPGLFSRNGYHLPGTEHIIHELKAWERHAGEPMFFDGEFVVDRGGDTLASTKAWCERDHKLGGTAGKLFLFDGFPRRFWIEGRCPTPLIERKARLAEIAAKVAADEAHRWEWRAGSRGDGQDASPVELVDHFDAFTPDCIVRGATRVWQRGGEGLVVKDASAPYVLGRNRAWLKVGRPWQSKLGWRLAA